MVDPLASLGGVTGVPPRRGAPMAAARAGTTAAASSATSAAKDAFAGLEFDGLERAAER